MSMQNESSPASRNLSPQEVWKTAYASWSAQGAHLKEIYDRLSSSGWDRALPWELPETIFWVGEGSSLHAAALAETLLNAQMLWARQPRLSVVCPASNFAERSGRLSGSRNWFVGFSHRGTTAQTLLALREARNKGFNTLWIASKDVTVLPTEAHICIGAGPLETIEPHTSALTTGVAAASLMIGDSNTADLWKAMMGEFDPPRIKIPAEVTQWLANPTPGFIVGHGPAEWLARELALKCLELGGPAHVAGPSENFFHGYSLTLPTRGIPVRVLQLSLAEDPRDADWKGNFRPEKSEIVRWDLTSGGEREYVIARAIFTIQKAALEATRPE